MNSCLHFQVKTEAPTNHHSHAASEESVVVKGESANPVRVVREDHGERVATIRAIVDLVRRAHLARNLLSVARPNLSEIVIPEREAVAVDGAAVVLVELVPLVKDAENSIAVVAVTEGEEHVFNFFGM